MKINIHKNNFFFYSTLIDITDRVLQVIWWKDNNLHVYLLFIYFYRAEETTFDKKEKDQFDNFCTVYITDLVPYLNKCLQTLFPPSQLAQILGVSLLEFNKMVSVNFDLSVVYDKVELFFVPCCKTEGNIEILASKHVFGRPLHLTLWMHLFRNYSNNFVQVL